MATTAKLGATVLWLGDGRIVRDKSYGNQKLPGMITALSGTVASLAVFTPDGVLPLTGVALDAGGTTPNSYAVVDLSA